MAAAIMVEPEIVKKKGTRNAAETPSRNSTKASKQDQGTVLKSYYIKEDAWRGEPAAAMMLEIVRYANRRGSYQTDGVRAIAPNFVAE